MDSVCLHSNHAEFFFRLGQVGGVAISSAVFQSKLDGELRRRITGPGAAEVRDVPRFYCFSRLTLAPIQLILKIRQSTRTLATLPPDLQKIARDSYAISLKSVFIFSACCTLLAFIVRLPVSSIRFLLRLFANRRLGP